MAILTLIKRITKGSPITPIEHDQNLENIENSVNGLDARMNVALKEDGTLKDESAGPSAIAATVAGSGLEKDSESGALKVIDRSSDTIDDDKDTRKLSLKPRSVTPDHLAGASRQQTVIFREQYPSGIDTGTLTPNEWYTRTINQIEFDDTGEAQLSTGVMTLPPGEWEAVIYVPGYQCNWHRGRLKEENGDRVFYGTSERSGEDKATTTQSIIVARFSQPVATKWRIEHRATRGGRGGAASAFEVAEYFTTAVFRYLGPYVSPESSEQD